MFLAQQLGDVRQVRHQPFAVPPGQQTVAHALQLGGLEDRGDAAFPRVSGPLPQRVRETVGQLLAAVDQGLGGVSEEHGGRGGAHHAGAVRLVAGCSTEGRPLKDDPAFLLAGATIGIPISTYVVIMFVQFQGSGDAGVWVYKHSPSVALATPNPPTNVSAE